MTHDEKEDARDLKIAELARRHAAATRTNCLIGNEKVLRDVSHDLGTRMSAPGVTEQLVRAALTCGPAMAGQMFLDLVQKCIDADADCEAIKEVEHMERAAAKDRCDELLEGAMNHLLATA